MGGNGEGKAALVVPAGAVVGSGICRAGGDCPIRTTGGGGWGDPITREVGDVVRDVRWGKVSVRGAREDYGVALTYDDTAAHVDSSSALTVDDAATAALRDEIQQIRLLTIDGE